MTLRRLAAAGAAGAMGFATLALTAGPAYADPSISASPNPFVPGSTLTLGVKDCTDKPVQVDDDGLFATAPSWTKGAAEGAWTAAAKTNKVAPGHTYVAKFTCNFEDKKFELTLTVNPKEDEKPEPPKFQFGYDDVKMSTTKVAPNGKTAFTVTCPTEVTITSNGYTKNPLPVTKSGKNTWTANGTFKSSLPDPTLATVACKGYGSVKYSTSPEKGEMTPKKPTGKIPTGRIDTGDGSTVAGGGPGTSLLAGGAATALAGAGLGAMMLRRRIGQER
ncbi:hypothetical protein [Actinomadura sp. 9N407]|uniref:hypothetical protein n=1 Tax=Actinomadura sp. 9N407 TaxID=3375154 RepID=UPI0037B3CE0F